MNPVEIGSEFPLEVLPKVGVHHIPDWLRFGEDQCLTFSGRTALEIVLRDISHETMALLPSYCCDSMLEPFRAAGIKFKFYRVDYKDGLNIHLEIPDTCNLILWCNYFGFSMPYPEEKLLDFKKHGGIVIEDITHSLFSKSPWHEESDYLVASIRKWGPLISGGLACKGKGKFRGLVWKVPDTDFIRNKMNAMLLKADYLRSGGTEKKKRYLKSFSEYSYRLTQQYSMLPMDEISVSLLNSWDVAQIRSIRQKNTHILYEQLWNMKGLDLLFKSEDYTCPLFVPIILDHAYRDSLRRKLIGKDIYCPIHWPHPAAVCSSNLYDMELSLICDQRYSEEDMLDIISVIKER